MFWDFYGPQIAGSVVKLPYSELQRVHQAVPAANIKWSAHGIDNVAVTASSQIFKATFNDIPCDSVAYLSVTLKAQETPKRIKYKQTFTGNVKCYGIFGGLLSGAYRLNETGLYPFDSTKDKISEYKDIGSSSVPHLPLGSIYGCQEGNFWEKRGNSAAQATITQRCKPNMKSFTLTTFVKCGTGSFELSNFNFIQ
ncbi:uncharacterized protein LOC110254984 [Exaiptasia diaphana]|uniref:Uncharacterized protein n=1 Tax=Exaiptasia diaphana TaxID=2652724 RepID=A0A913YCP0_EXADI|nr:uncharacterized protein LOC110254984 [Exaiptasia diaphana]